MNNKCIIIYEHDDLYQILIEISDILDLQIKKISKNQLNRLQLNDSKKFLIITKKKIPNINNQLILKEFPIQINKLIEKINICFLKQNFSEQSGIHIGKYILNINSRVLILETQSLKLTEKEIQIITYLFKNKRPIRINELQLQVWGHKTSLETHTVETHIYRLRKKILKIFRDDKFIISSNKGYKIK